MKIQQKARNWLVYLLRCADGTFYCGITTDMARRLRQHNGLIKGGARYTRTRRPVELVGKFLCQTQGDAQRMEIRIKRMSRYEKLLIFNRSVI